MLYARETNEGQLVADEQMVGIREHLSNKHRMIFLSGAISGETESHNTLLAFDSLCHDPIKVIITSFGGELDSAFLFYDTMRLVQSPIFVYGRICASAAAILLAAGQKRYLSPHAKVMLHLPFGRIAGDARDWEIQNIEMTKYKEGIVEILIECGAKKSRIDILHDMDRQFWLEPKEAIEYGLADAIMTADIMKEWLK
uniref:Putative protease n=1 Tax=viral metagenome TaxID=1070528 RepID=A0A6M3KWT4_9ZZZZ